MLQNSWLFNGVELGTISASESLSTIQEKFIFYGNWRFIAVSIHLE
jgi:hypothetical protein